MIVDLFFERKIKQLEHLVRAAPKKTIDHLLQLRGCSVSRVPLQTAATDLLYRSLSHTPPADVAAKNTRLGVRSWRMCVSG